MRLAHTRKRPTLEQEATDHKGSLKTGIVAKDPKVWNKESISDTYAALHCMIAWRLVVARANLKMGQ